jgi:ubiquinone/menaquinone biosynthesis C-methylase UbiE
VTAGWSADNYIARQRTGGEPAEWGRLLRVRAGCGTFRHIRAEGVTVNQIHLELCSSAEWADTVRRFLIPWSLEGIELGDHLLELGPGPGRTTEVLLETADRITALDLDEGLVAALAHRLTSPGFEAVHGDATRLPFADATFSAVVSLTMLHHLPSASAQDAVFAETARVLRPGGVFVANDSLDSDDFRALHVDDICVPIDPGTLGDRLARAGFERVEVATNEFATRARAWVANG